MHYDEDDYHEDDYQEDDITNYNNFEIYYKIEQQWYKITLPYLHNFNSLIILIDISYYHKSNLYLLENYIIDIKIIDTKVQLIINSDKESEQLFLKIIFILLTQSYGDSLIISKNEIKKVDIFNSHQEIKSIVDNYFSESKFLDNIPENLENFEDKTIYHRIFYKNLLHLKKYKYFSVFKHLFKIIIFIVISKNTNLLFGLLIGLLSIIIIYNKYTKNFLFENVFGITTYFIYKYTKQNLITKSNFRLPLYLIWTPYLAFILNKYFHKMIQTNYFKLQYHFKWRPIYLKYTNYYSIIVLILLGLFNHKLFINLLPILVGWFVFKLQKTHYQFYSVFIFTLAAVGLLLKRKHSTKNLFVFLNLIFICSLIFFSHFLKKRGQQEVYKMKLYFQAVIIIYIVIQELTCIFCDYTDYIILYIALILIDIIYYQGFLSSDNVPIDDKNYKAIDKIFTITFLKEIEADEISNQLNLEESKLEDVNIEELLEKKTSDNTFIRDSISNQIQDYIDQNNTNNFLEINQQKLSNTLIQETSSLFTNNINKFELYRKVLQILQKNLTNIICVFNINIQSVDKIIFSSRWSFSINN